MALGLSLQLPEQLALLGNLDDLVIDDTVCSRHFGKEREKVSGYLIAIDGHGLIGLDDTRQVYLVNINKAE